MQVNLYIPAAFLLALTYGARDGLSNYKQVIEVIE
ncbi:hypothetical protein BH11PSE12_BH11PSE12_23440 [soil metagenome]